MDIVTYGFKAVKTFSITDFLEVNGVNRVPFAQPNNPLSVKC